MSLNNIKINDNTVINTGVVYDISKATDQTYDTLADALGTDGRNVPLEVREGGMSVRYVQTSDNKYVQYRLMSKTFNTNKSNWQGIDIYPKTNSKNFVDSNGIYISILTNLYASLLDGSVYDVDGDAIYAENNDKILLYN